MTIWICFHLKLFWTQNFSNFKWILHLYLIELNDPKVWAWWGWLVRKTTESIKMVFLNDLGTYQWDRRKLQTVCLTSDILPYSISNVLKPEHSWGPGRSSKPAVWVGIAGTLELVSQEPDHLKLWMSQAGLH